MFSPAYLRYVGSASLQNRFSLMWKRKETKSFDVTTGHAQTTPSRHALNYSWGEHCIMITLTSISNLIFLLHNTFYQTPPPAPSSHSSVSILVVRLSSTASLALLAPTSARAPSTWSHSIQIRSSLGHGQEELGSPRWEGKFNLIYARALP